MNRSSETGIALVVTLFMVLVLSVLAASMIFVSRTETMSSLNYRTMSEARYAAESAVHASANHLIYTYAAPGTATDPLANYNLTVSPVTYNGQPVVLSSDTSTTSNYPVSAVRDAFVAASAGTLSTTIGSNAFAASAVTYATRARLLSMMAFTDSINGTSTALQTWEITGRGSVGGVGSAQVEVSAIIERPKVSVYKYAAFATSNGCGALSFQGGATTDSYDSRSAMSGGKPVMASNSGNVGTNGGLSGNGAKTDVHGTLSTPRTGVGACGGGNVTASTGGVTVDGGLVKLPQEVAFPTPPVMSPLPPVTSFGTSDCASTAGCTPSGGDARFSPASGTTVRLGNVAVANHSTLYLNAGIYEINSIEVKGDLVVESGPVIIKIAGTGTSTPMDFTAGAVTNTSYIAANLQLIYGGTGDVKLRGNAGFSAVVYAPNAAADFAGNGDFYGALVTKTVGATGGSSIHYDRALDNSAFTVGNPIMSSFSWKSF